MKIFMVMGILFFSVFCYAGTENVVSCPEGGLRHIYETEELQVRTSVGRFIDIHRKCQDLLWKSKVDVGNDKSFIWCAPYFGHAVFASVFWNTNQIVVATIMQKDCIVRTYPVTKKMSMLRTQLEKELPKYQFVCPLGGDGNVSEVGVWEEGSRMKVFSLQVGRCFRMNKKKRFYGTKESVSVYECMVEADDYFRSLAQKKSLSEVCIPLEMVSEVRSVASEER